MSKYQENQGCCKPLSVFFVFLKIVIKLQTEIKMILSWHVAQSASLQSIQPTSEGHSSILSSVSISKTKDPHGEYVEPTMADCGTSVAVVLTLVLSALAPYQKRPVVRFVILSATTAAYSAVSIRGSPSLP